jgi:hypothetical protein
VWKAKEAAIRSLQDFVTGGQNFEQAYGDGTDVDSFIHIKIPLPSKWSNGIRSTLVFKAQSALEKALGDVSKVVQVSIEVRPFETEHCGLLVLHVEPKPQERSRSKRSNSVA